jgi:predicted nicotinamide N-methyase
VGTARKFAIREEADVPPVLAQRLDLVEEPLALAGRELRLLRPRSAEALLDEEAFEREEFLPYWAELWPSGLALARHVEGLDVGGRRVLELGCGLGLPSLAAALGGAGEVLASDWSPDAVELLGVNAARNAVRLRAQKVAWEEPSALVDGAPWDLVLAADVLYERRDVPPLSRLLAGLRCNALVATPERPAVREFLDAVATTLDVEKLQAVGSGSVAVYRLSPRAVP